MAKKIAPLLPATETLLARFGDRLRFARLRRRLPAKQVAERAGMSPMTLRGLERGGAGVTMGAYLAVMQVLGMESDLDLLANADPLGRELQDARMTARAASVTTAPRGATGVAAPGAASSAAAAASMPKAKHRELPEPNNPAWKPGSGFASAQELAGLLDESTPAPARAARRR